MTRRLAAFFFEDGLVDALAQRLRDVVLTAVGNDLAEVGLEVERAETRGTLVEMFADLGPALVGELTVEIVIEPFDRLVAVDLGLFGSHRAFSHQPGG
jgi:hypothetical protein